MLFVGKRIQCSLPPRRLSLRVYTLQLSRLHPAKSLSAYERLATRRAGYFGDETAEHCVVSISESGRIVLISCDEGLRRTIEYVRHCVAVPVNDVPESSLRPLGKTIYFRYGGGPMYRIMCALRQQYISPKSSGSRANRKFALAS